MNNEPPCVFILLVINFHKLKNKSRQLSQWSADGTGLHQLRLFFFLLCKGVAANGISNTEGDEDTCATADGSPATRTDRITAGWLAIALFVG